MEQVKRFSSIYVFYLIFFLFMINRLFFFSPGIAEQSLSCLVYPFLKVRSILAYPFKSCWNHMQSVSDLQYKIDELVQKNESLQAKIIEQEARLLFSEQTEEVVEFAQRYGSVNKKLVHVLMNVISEKEDFIIIDAGTHQGIQKDDVAIYKNMLVGRVIEVYPWYSKVVLISDIRCKISAECKLGVVGIFSGKNNGKVELNYIPHFKEVCIADMILSTGNGLVYPKGFALGEVVSIQTDNVCHHIQAKTFIDFATLSYVYIFTK